MNVLIRWYTPTENNVDLMDYGHDADITWDDLNEEERNEVLDHIRSETTLYIKEIKTLEQ